MSITPEPDILIAYAALGLRYLHKIQGFRCETEISINAGVKERLVAPKGGYRSHGITLG